MARGGDREELGDALQGAERRGDADTSTFFLSALDRRSTADLMHAIDEQLWERGIIERRVEATDEPDELDEQAAANDPPDDEAEPT